jgi:cobalt-zinc-cadmium efflux system membrane fusion protein
MKRAIAAVLTAGALAAVLACSRDMPTAPHGAAGAGIAQITIAPSSQRAAGITVVPAALRSVPVVVSAPGSLTVNEQRTEHIGVLFPGTVTKVFANVGDSVRAGQVLALVHSHDLHDAVAAYQSALAEVERCRRQLAYTRTVRDRYRRLYAIQYASREETERSELQYQNALAEQEKAAAALRAAQAHLAGMLQVPERGLERLNVDADAMPIKTPRAGVVIARMVTPGTAVQPGQETFSVSDFSSLWMIAAVNEADIHQVRVGLAASVRVRAYPDTVFNGWVDQLGPRLDPTTRTLSVRVVVPNSEGLLRPNMFATAEIAKGGSREAIFVHQVAVQDLNGNPVVFVRHGDATFEVRPVGLGERRGGLVEISAGVRPGESVVDGGAFVVKSQFLTRTLSQD